MIRGKGTLRLTRLSFFFPNIACLDSPPNFPEEISTIRGKCSAISTALPLIVEIYQENLGVGGFEPPYTEVVGFTVRCNWPLCDTPMNLEKKICWRKELNPQPSDYK